MGQIRVGVLSLGCPKNAVDSEVMMGVLKSAGYEITTSAEKADVIIVNTCGFINAAKEEAIDAILQMAQLKTNGSLRALIAAGCLAQRYPEELLAEIPELDGVAGTGAVPLMGEIVTRVLAGERVNAVGRPQYELSADLPRLPATPFYFSYLKIAEGCSNRCRYCAIPLIRGSMRSRPIEDLVAEVRQLVERGSKEIIVVAQDTTSYGIDLYGRPSLAELLRQVAAIEGVRWIRLMYCYPTGISDELLRVMAEEEKICRYLDIPLQHISDRILQAMGRRGSEREIRAVLEKVRKLVPGVVLRTTFLVGFPGETDDDFKRLLGFMKEMAFERAGVFCYSPEEGTPAASMPDQVPEEVKEERYHQAMLLQRRISRRFNQSRVGSEVEVIVEGSSVRGAKSYYGRSQADAPEIDGQVLIRSPGRVLRPGEIVKVRITRAMTYDVAGELITTEAMQGENEHELA